MNDRPPLHLHEVDLEELMKQLSRPHPAVAHVEILETVFRRVHADVVFSKKKAKWNPKTMSLYGGLKSQMVADACFNTYGPKKKKPVTLPELHRAYLGFFDHLNSREVRSVFMQVKVKPKLSLCDPLTKEQQKEKFLRIVEKWYQEYVDIVVQENHVDFEKTPNMYDSEVSDALYFAFRTRNALNGFSKRKIPQAIVGIRLDFLHSFLCFKVERILTRKGNTVQDYLKKANLFVDYCRWYWFGSSTHGIEGQYPLFEELTPWDYWRSLGAYCYLPNGSFQVPEFPEIPTPSKKRQGQKKATDPKKRKAEVVAAPCSSSPTKKKDTEKQTQRPQTQNERQSAFQLLLGEFLPRHSVKMPEVAGLQKMVSEHFSDLKNNLKSVQEAHETYRKEKVEQVNALKSEIAELRASIENGKNATIQLLSPMK